MPAIMAMHVSQKKNWWGLLAKVVPAPITGHALLQAFASLAKIDKGTLLFYHDRTPETLTSKVSTTHTLNHTR